MGKGQSPSLTNKSGWNNGTRKLLFGSSHSNNSK